MYTAGKVAIVTGVAPGGIGVETVRGLCALGARVVLASRDERRAREAMADVLADSRVRSAGGSCDFIALDLSDLRNVDGFVAEFRARHRRLDLLVNNAGLNSRSGEVQTAWRRALP